MTSVPAPPSRFARLAGIVALCLASAASDATNLRRQDARALNAETGKLLYRETHWTMLGARPERWVVYRCADGKPFARKYVAGGASATAPDFVLEDARDGYREGVRPTPPGRSVFVAAPGRSESKRSITIPDNGVIDAGFDAAVRKHWPSLTKNQPVQLQFLLPSRKRFYPVRVQRVGSVDWLGVPAERLSMRLDAWFGFAVPAVTLVYARDDRRLLEFAGTGNVRNSDGKFPQIRIVFDTASQPATAADIAAARTLTLTGRCDF